MTKEDVIAPCVIILAIAMTVTILLCIGAAPDRAKAAADKIVELYKVRVEAAKIEKQSDQVKLEHARVRLDRLKSLHGTAAISLREVLDAQRDVDMFAVEILADDNAIREAELHLELMEVGIDSGAVDLHDLRIPTELIRKH